ncbi:MAG: zinc ribbon domain-containing protein [archaeon]|nr:MAG: zinc ribbon domain-containing protein [archaeon]
MPKVCPWCGKPFHIKRVVKGDKIRDICSKCGFKIKEFKKPEPVKKEEKPPIAEVKESEKPVVQEKPIWPIIATIVAIVIVIIILIKVFLV